MSEQLYAIPPAGRRRMALGLAPLGAVLLVAGVLTVSLDGVGWKFAGLLVAVLALALLGVAWGLRRSAAMTEAADAEHRLDEVLAAAAGSGGATCATTGLACGSGSASGGCGASCLGRSG